MVTAFAEKEYIYRQLEKLSPENLAEVARFIEFLNFQSKREAIKEISDEDEAFGIWADRPETESSADMAAKLRRKLETRQDVKTSA